MVCRGGVWCRGVVWCGVRSLPLWHSLLWSMEMGAGEMFLTPINGNLLIPRAAPGGGPAAPAARPCARRLVALGGGRTQKRGAPRVAAAAARYFRAAALRWALAFRFGAALRLLPAALRPAAASASRRAAMAR